MPLMKAPKLLTRLVWNVAMLPELSITNRKSTARQPTCSPGESGMPPRSHVIGGSGCGPDDESGAGGDDVDDELSDDVLVLELPSDVVDGSDVDSVAAPTLGSTPLPLTGVGDDSQATSAARPNMHRCITRAAFIARARLR